MLYNLRIGKTRYTGKTRIECINIIGSRLEDVKTECITRPAQIRTDLLCMTPDVLRLAYYGHDGKIFLSINQKKGVK